MHLEPSRMALHAILRPMAGDLDRAVRTVVERCLALGEGDDVLVVCDPDRTALGDALLVAARETGADGALTVLPPNPARGTEPPPSVAAAFAACTAFLAPCLPSLSHTQARKRATEGGARGATLPGVTEELLARLMSVDFDAMAARCHAVAELLTASGEAHLTCPKGTDFRLELQGRTAIADDGDLTARGAFGNLPCGEGFISPASGVGTIAASSLFCGVLEEPLLLEVREGELLSASGPGDVARTFLEELDAHGEAGRNLAELGVGTNDRATLTGNVLEDEKILGTAHVAFGASAAIGGTVSVPVHQDVVVLDPTLTVDGTTVLEDGRYVLG
jgi:leucyl aminopeptidase (aminopeptidase T)